MKTLKLALALIACAAVLGPVAAADAQPAKGRTAAATALSAEDKALVDKAAAYLQNLAAAKGEFIQTDGRGRTLRGTFYLQRPGKARFEYAPPSGLLIVSDGSNVNVHDRRLILHFPVSRINHDPVHAKTAEHLRPEFRIFRDQCGECFECDE